MSHTHTIDIAELLPSILDIRDAHLREQVGAVWEDAMREGNAGRGWTIDHLRSVPFTLLAGATEMTFIDHLNCCARQSIAIAGVLRTTFGDRIPIDTDTLIAGALLADVGKLLEFELRPDGTPFQCESGRLVRHPFTGVALCHRHGVPPEVMHIVAAHSHEGDRIERTIECIIFHHADFVDFDIAQALGRAASTRGAGR